MVGFIYKITNKVNGKSYIGQTRKSVEFRWRQHKNSKDNYDLHNAIRKFGEDNFEITTLKECDYSELDKWEIYYIAQYNTFRNGYNMTKGGSAYNPNRRYLNGYIAVEDKYTEIVSMYKAGFSATKIASLYEVDRHVICNILKQLGFKISNNKITINREELTELVQKYETGYSLKQLAKEYGCSSVGLKDFLIKKGVDIKKKYAILEDEKSQLELINSYVNRDMSLKDLMLKYHCSYQTFKQILNKHNIIPVGKGASYKLTDRDNLEVIKMYNEGYKVMDIVSKFKVDKSTIYSILKRYNVEYRRL